MLLYPRHTLPTAAAPVFVAMGLAHHHGVLRPRVAAAAFVAGWLIQVGGVITDNYFNLRRHADDEEHADFIAALRAGVVSLGELRAAIIVCYAGAAVVSSYLLFIGGLPALAIGVASILASIAYSAGPFPLGDNGLGDIVFFIFFGVVSVVATYYLQAVAALHVVFPIHWLRGTVAADASIASLAVAALTTNILIIDNIRDLVYDRKKGEQPLAVLIGPNWSRVEYVALLVLAYIVPLAMWMSGWYGPLMLLTLVSLPYAIVVAVRVMKRHTYEQLVPMTPQAGQVLLAHSVLFALALAA